MLFDTKDYLSGYPMTVIDTGKFVTYNVLWLFIYPRLSGQTPYVPGTSYWSVIRVLVAKFFLKACTRLFE